jgi:hypothetical protein
MLIIRYNRYIYHKVLINISNFKYRLKGLVNLLFYVTTKICAPGM